MPRVPRVTNQEVRAQAAPIVEQQRVNLNTPSGLGSVSQGLADVAKLYKQQAEYSDALRVEEAVNQLRERQLDLTLGQEKGYTNFKGRNALPSEGASLTDRFAGEFTKVSNDLEGTLANDRQKALFRQYATRAGMEFKTGLMRHENSELDSWRKETVNGVIAVESENAARNWNNTQAIDLSRSRIDINLARMRDAEGLPADEVQRLRTQALSRLHAGVLEQAIASRDLGYADKYLQQYGDEMTAETALKARTLVKKEQDTQYAFGRAQQVFQKLAPSIEPSDYSRLVNLAAPAGEEGRTNLNAQIKRFGGDLAKALAAHKTTPEETQAAIDQATKDGKPGDWLSYLPKAAQEYTADVVAKFQSGAGAPKRATLQDIADTLRADPQLANDPTKYKMAYEEAKRLFEEQDKARRQRQDDAEGELYRQLAANGGDFYSVDPRLRAAIDPTKLDSAMQFASSMRKGEEVVTDLRVYNKLATDQEFLRSLSDAQFETLRGSLSPVDFKHFANERGKLFDKSVNQVEDINSAALNSTLNSRLASMGIDPTPGQKDEAGMRRVAAVRQFITRAVLDEQKNRGKKLTDAETIQMVDRLFATNSEIQKGIFFDSGGVPVLSMKPSQVPSEARKKIEAAFKAAGRKADDYDILQVYWSQKFSNKNSALNRAKPPQGAQNNE